MDKARGPLHGRRNSSLACDAIEGKNSHAVSKNEIHLSLLN
ncbi:hypothetical protein AB395_00005275 (plasmid) [Sinorhizobium fredii CCBAU 45436]|nr:hypothetical protein AB395_00005275 [Sinorhizobium fredii CCBAU 45436]